ncbi:lasso peptide isopeptide bond-forming cyclase [Streptomyces nodosus]|uniref:asparagine synthase (glutamine-hydrolyzing) n=1 Tax=Streptomyces nodosus TaxID=40318 RepID=A0A5P2WC33_9ACTN|nr:lasso peptide isopeptide bond-forming cyclase [Streptomyces nodosus]MBB4796129.1 asparagine synthase (glutamine-hydrolyzing) [Streptomyces nodosus]QEV42955.1 lasso peptide isopeptide bond-forming cyclase [Streptomyces nodosus]
MEFVVLPDCPAAAGPAARLAPGRRINHASGRPWIVGDWPDDQVHLVVAGPRRMALIGQVTLDEAAAKDRLGRLRSLDEVDRIASRLVGSCHVLVSLDGTVRVQGSVVGVRQIFSAAVDGVTVAASGVAPLARLTGADLDESVLAARLLAPGGAPWPLAQRPVRRGVDPLTTGHWLRMDAEGRARQVRWWRLPEASRSLAQGAAAVRTALDEALAARVRPGRTISADLSGGMDSTSLCFLAAAANADLVTYHVAPLDSANEDTRWAHRAAALLPHARHHTLTADRAENLFDVGYTAEHANTAPEGPSTWASGLAHIRDLAHRARGEGSSLHLSGFGGDELFGRMPTSAWSLARARPIGGLLLVNRYRLANRWSWGATVRALLDRSTFAQNLTAVATRIGAPPPSLDEPDFGWVFAPRMPAWATPDAVAAVRELLTEAAGRTPEPLDADRTRHQALASLVFEGSTIRQVNTVLAGTGIAWDAPFLDDRVIEAALAVRVEERLASARFKPLLTDAVRGAVPAGILDRRDKGEFSAEAFRGLERNRARLLELCEDSRLARLGLIDPERFRAAVLNPGPMSHHLQPIDTTVACESWLRTHPQTTTDVQDTGVRR